MLVFAWGDAWAGTTTGRVAIVRATDYRVEWIEPNGQRTIGPKVGWQPVPVTRTERAKYARAFLATSGISGRGGAGRPPGSIGAVPEEMMTDAKIAELVANSAFAPTKGPFTDAAPMIDPDGNLWVERSVAEELPSTWDVFDRAGRPIRSWRLPPARRLAGLGRGRIYLIATDEDGNERLERYAPR
jgi:hypothetical protein